MKCRRRANTCRRVCETAPNRAPDITGVRGLGLMIGFDLESEDVATEVVEESRQNGLLLIKAGPATIRIVPPLTITVDELDEGLDALDAARGA